MFHVHNYCEFEFIHGMAIFFVIDGELINCFLVLILVGTLANSNVFKVPSTCFEMIIRNIV